EWIPVPSGDEVTPQGGTYRRHILSNLLSAVIKFSCKNDTLGDGNENQFVTGPCEKNWDGSITYQCTSGNWMEFRRDCILQVINDLQRNFLIVERIPAFVSNLSNVTVQNNQIITQSPLTVQTIVEILVNIASILQNIIIDKAVMVVCIFNFFANFTSVLTAASWQSLTKENTSISLLSAIENVTDRLSDVDFTFTETFIELNRTVIKNSYRGKSNLPNSTTEILIPQVLKTTSLTVLVFAKLGKVLPSRNTGNLVSHINGNVVIVKVNETLNNISFTFDITDQSLVNPQCVFWNFNLNAWDSTGCEAKPSGNETGKITCECNHTTTFSILMFNPNDHIALDYITYIGVSISMASLILCLIIESIMWKSINDTSNYTSYMRHVSIVNIVVSLLIANICFIIGAAIAEPEQPTSVGRCSPVVFFMHFFYLALFFWMLISALLLFYRTVMVSHGHGQSWSQMLKAKMMVIAFIVGYGAPLLIAVITVASTAGQENYISKRNSCWLNWYESKALLAFVIPALTILAINLVVLIVVLYKMLGRGVASIQRDEKHALVVIAICVAILTPFFGLTWGFGIGTMVSQDFGMHVVFALLNSLQVSLSEFLF
uniref:Uncharacterized protein n=1 Tax=Cyprinus carpio TaxID=7962 RepID=A0A8C1P6B5_CYPCA